MDLVIRAAAVYLVVLLFTRVLGKRELSSMQPIDLILLIIIGDLIQQGVTQNDVSITGVVIVLSTIGLMQLGVSYLSYRFNRLRPFLDGEPVVLVENGKVIKRNLSRERMTEDDLAEEARKNEIFSLEEVRWAVLETTGKISFIKR